MNKLEVCTMSRNYTMQKTIMAIAIIAVIALTILNLVWKDPEPDAVFPMANQHIEWTYAKGTVKD